jgi:hypothetical protein
MDLDPNHNFVWHTRLNDFPEIAREIGHFTAAFSGMEFSLWKIFGFVLGTDEIGAMHLLGAIQSFTVRMDAVERYFERRKCSLPKADLYPEVFKDARAANRFRNLLAHGNYFTNEGRTQVLLQAYLTNPMRDKRPELWLSVPRINNEMRMIERVNGNIYSIIKATAPESIEHYDKKPPD